MNAEQMDKQIAQWWHDTPLPDGDWDKEIAALNAQAKAIDDLPQWAIDVRSAMPRWGMEMCSYRWLDGLDQLMTMIETQAPCGAQLGVCGDVPGRIYDQVEKRVAAVERYTHGAHARDAFEQRILDKLGAPDPARIEAAQCFCELVRASFFTGCPPATFQALTERWRGVSVRNAILAPLLSPGDMADVLQSTCGYLTLKRLDIFIEMLAGDVTRAEQSRGSCNVDLRYVLQDDPQRYAVTYGYLWGWHTALEGLDRFWLRETKPQCAGSAIYAYNRMAEVVQSETGRWLVASLLKTTRIWAERTLSRVTDAPAWAGDLPRLATI